MMRGSGYFPMQRQRLHTPFLVGQEEERVKRFFLALLAAVLFCALCYFEMHCQKERNSDDVKGLPPARSKQIGTEAILKHKRFAKRAG